MRGGGGGGGAREGGREGGREGEGIIQLPEAES